MNTGLDCAACDRPATTSHPFYGCRHNGVELGDEPLCNNCLESFIEGATLGDLAVRIFKKRGVWGAPPIEPCGWQECSAAAVTTRDTPWGDLPVCEAHTETPLHNGASK